MDALALLKAGQEKISHLFEKMDRVLGHVGIEREGLYMRLKHEMSLHMHIEEEIFYPAVMDHPQTHSLGSEAMEEHHALKSLWNELASIPVDSVEWLIKFTVLKESLMLHNEELERVLFPTARKVLSPQEWEDLSAVLEEENLHHSPLAFAPPLWG